MLSFEFSSVLFSSKILIIIQTGFKYIERKILMSQVIAIIVLLSGLFLALGTTRPEKISQRINNHRR